MSTFAIPQTSPSKKREIVGWMMYDWANSAFVTTVATALLGPYLTALAQRAVGENGVVMGLGPLGSVTAKSFFPLCVSVSVLLQVFLFPLLGAIADYSNLKKRLLAATCSCGVLATCLFFFIQDGLYALGGLLFIVANLSYGASVVLYNAFLSEICGEEERDRVSSGGYALGYLGGGLLLLVNLALIKAAPRLGLSADLAIRLWTGAVVYAYGFLQTTTQAWGMSAVIALVLGGSQALSRSLFSRMIPPGREASFFSLYEISERGTSWIGPLVFGVVVAVTNSYRQAILCLVGLFVVGTTILLLTDTDRAILEAADANP